MATESRRPAWMGIAVLVLDVAALIVFYHIMPPLRRPFETLMLLTFVLAVMTAIVLRTSWLRGLAVIVASLAASAYMVEMAEKLFSVTKWMQPKPAAVASTGKPGGQYTWTPGNLAEYLESKERARADGLDAEALADHFVGDVFAGTDRNRLVVAQRDAGPVLVTATGLKPQYLTGTALGYELNPDNLIRDLVVDSASGKPVVDVAYRTTSHGYRTTQGDEDAAETYIFLGDSYTFGAFLNDDETQPYWFSRGLDFQTRVMNTGVSGWGPHQALRMLELERYPGLEKGGPARVEGVFFGLIDTHANRAVNPTTKYMTAPYYVLKDGALKFSPRNAPSGFTEKMSGMMEKSRVYPVLRDRLASRIHESDTQYKWQLTVAILAEIDRISRDRFGVPLTVVYWDFNRQVVEDMRRQGLDVVLVSDIFPEGENWQDMAILYTVFDGHPSAYAHRLVAGHLIARREKTEGVPQ